MCEKCEENGIGEALDALIGSLSKKSISSLRESCLKECASDVQRGHIKGLTDSIENKHVRDSLIATLTFYVQVEAAIKAGRFDLAAMLMYEIGGAFTKITARYNTVRVSLDKDREKEDEKDCSV